MIKEKKKTMTQHKQDLRDAHDKKAEAAEKAWKKGFQTTTEKDILDAGTR